MRDLDVKIKGLQFYDGDQGDRPFTVLAHGTVAVGPITFQGVGLAWSQEDGATALTPSARVPTGAHAVRWPFHHPLLKAVAEEMLALYRRMGGKIPTTKREFVPFSELDLPEDAPRDDVVAKLKTLSEERGTTCFTGRYELPPEVPVEHRHPMRKAALAEEVDDPSGLHRMLGIGAVEETMEKAGL